MNFYLYQMQLLFILSFKMLSVRDVWTGTQMQTHLRLVITHAANKFLENCTINCKKTFINKINVRFRNSCSSSGKWKIDSKQFRFQKKANSRFNLFLILIHKQPSREKQNSEFPKTFFGGYLFVFVEYLCKRSPKIKAKYIKNYSSILAIVHHRN